MNKLIPLLLISLSGAASAHAVGAHDIGLLNGFMHMLLSIDHLFEIGLYVAGPFGAYWIVRACATSKRCISQSNPKQTVE